MKRTIVPNIEMRNGTLSCKGRSGHWCSLFKKQGSLDGACATYSTVMDLLILRAINGPDTFIHAEHKSPTTKNLFKVFTEDYGMHRDGQTFYKIRRMLLESFSKEVDVIHRLTSGQESIDTISDSIKNGIPVVMSISNASLSHAMLAIGIEEEMESTTKILLLDPSGDYLHGKKLYNAEIDIAGGRGQYYPYTSSLEGILTTQSVQLDDILIITKN